MDRLGIDADSGTVLSMNPNISIPIHLVNKNVQSFSVILEILLILTDPLLQLLFRLQYLRLVGVKAVFSFYLCEKWSEKS